MHSDALFSNATLFRRDVRVRCRGKNLGGEKFCYDELRAKRETLLANHWDDTLCSMTASYVQVAVPGCFELATEQEMKEPAS